MVMAMDFFGKNQRAIPAPTKGETPFPKRLRWWIQNPPEGSVFLHCTPAMAEEFLRLNDKNRPVSALTVRKYANRMRAGWKNTGETIIVSKNGRLLNGQHRLEACLDSGCAFPVHIIFGIEDDAFAFMDIGRTRTCADIFAINGVENYTVMSAAALWLWRYEKAGMGEPGSETRPTHDKLYEFYLEHEGLQDSYTPGTRFSANKVASPSLMTALHYICAQKNRAEADAFFKVLATGIGLKSSREPTARLRKRLLDARIAGAALDDIYAAAFTVMTWNAIRKGEGAPLLRWRGEQNPTQTFPRVI